MIIRGTLRVRGGNLENVIKEMYGQSTFSDVKILKYNPEKEIFEARVWDGNFGPGDNTTWIKVPLAFVAKKFGDAVAKELMTGLKLNQPAPATCNTVGMYETQREQIMTVKEKIRKLIAKEKVKGFSNACLIWKGYGPLGQQRYGWWIDPIGKNARWIGSSWEEIKKLW